VTHVEHTYCLSDGVVFFCDSGVRDGHVIAGEFGHFGAEGGVFLGEWCIFHDEIRISGKGH
jgi:hypothetical protein